jgi:hypothetical protein
VFDGHLRLQMSAVWVLLAAICALALALLGRVLVGRLREDPAVIEELEDDTTLDPATGAVRSVQAADLLVERRALDEIWTPTHLERLGRTYWRFLTRVTLGIVRVRYSEHERSIVLLVPALRLLVFQAPEYEIDRQRGLVRWRIERGLLVSRRGRHGRGHLQIEVSRSDVVGAEQTRVHLEVEVANFYPSIASRLSRPVYNATQSRIHVLVTYLFLRSLSRMDLAHSRVGRFAA